MTESIADPLVAHRAEIHGSANDTYTEYRKVVDPDGSSHTRFNRSYHGLPVLGGDFIVHRDRAGNFVGASDGLVASLNVDTAATVPAATAASGAKSRFAGAVAANKDPRLVIDARSGSGRLAWETVVTGHNDSIPSVLHVLSDAHTGEMLGSFDELKTLRATPPATGDASLANQAPLQSDNRLESDEHISVVGVGRSLYVGTVNLDTSRKGEHGAILVDEVRGNGRTCDMQNGTTSCTTFEHLTQSDWGNGTVANRESAAADAHYGAAKTYDYFRNVHGRSGIFGDGRGVPSRVHYGTKFVNAFWDGSQMTYGDGSNDQRPLVSLDIAGHEMGHGVTDNIIPGGLTYSDESGGLNESASDIWGTMVEFYAGNSSDPGDYDIGEKINIRGNGTPLRYMYDPKKDGVSVNCWYAGVGNRDVHYSSGIGNLAYFFLAEGSGSTQFGFAPTCNASTVNGIGRAKAEKIWFRAMDVYFTSTTKYVSAGTNDARAATLSAASDLYGRCGTEYKAVQQAWSAVKVAGEDEECAPRPRQAQDGRIAVLSRASGTMEVFWISANGAVMHSFWYDGGSWATPSEIAPPGSASVSGHITGVSRTDKTMEIFWVGPDGSVQDAFWYEGATSWGRLSPPIAPAGSASTDGGIAALSRVPTSMEVWYIGANGSVKDSAWYEGGNWGSSYEIAPAGSASIHGSIAGVSRIPTSMEIWYTGADGSVQDRFWYEGDPQHWGFSQLAPPGSASLYGSISAVSRVPGAMEVQYIGANGSVQDKFWYEGDPQHWVSKELAPAGSASVRGGISVVSRVPTSIELWYIGANGSVQSKYWYEGSTDWAGAERAPAGSARTTQGVAAVSRLPKAMEFWYGSADGSLRDMFWYEGGPWTIGPTIAPAGSLP